MTKTDLEVARQLNATDVVEAQESLLPVMTLEVLNADGQLVPIQADEQLVMSFDDEEQIVEEVIATQRNARAANTNKAYASDWKRFATWCLSNNRQALPASAETVLIYLGWSVRQPGSIAINSLRRWVTSISHHHDNAEVVNATRHAAVKEWLAGEANRQKAEGRPTVPGRRQGQAVAVTRDQVVKAMEAIDLEGDHAGRRDRAMLAVAFAGFLRPSEVGEIMCSDVEAVEGGYTIRVDGKTGEGHRLCPRSDGPLNPAGELEAWHDQICGCSWTEDRRLFTKIDRHGNVLDGDPYYRMPDGMPVHVDGYLAIRPAFSNESVSDVFARRFKAVKVQGVTGHSLRRGAATDATEAGLGRRQIELLGDWVFGSKSAGAYVEGKELMVDSGAVELYA